MILIEKNGQDENLLRKYYSQVRQICMDSKFGITREACEPEGRGSMDGSETILPGAPQVVVQEFIKDSGDKFFRIKWQAQITVGVAQLGELEIEKQPEAVFPSERSTMEG